MQTVEERFMTEALKEAVKALERDEVPVGAVIVQDGKIIARAHNQNVLLKDPTAHAEMIAITEAAAFFKNERLLNTELYVTIEPCAMCAGALVLARAKRIVYGAKDPKAGACGSVTNLVHHRRLNHRILVKSGVLEKECRLLIQEFFKRKRQKEN
ncbi:MAG: tRNA adenosine(34) deaminase TadA [Candidatus Omnitrophica bacterium]|nr:tRNA adenosine(34) deaminase TadA [Candidatus Omnitrophota bacterium]